MPEFIYDLRFALRGLRRDRAFTLTAITMLALAIGLNVTVFAVMDTMLFRGFPLVKRNDRLLYLQERSQLCWCISLRDFAAWRANQSFEDMAIVYGGNPSTITDGDSSTELSPVGVSTNMFKLLGVAPAIGRDFAPADEAADAPRVAILTHKYWISHFAQRPDIIGHIVRIDKAPVTIIGVMPEGFTFPEDNNLYLPPDPTVARVDRAPGTYMAAGRLKDGVTVETARAEIQTISSSLAAAYPETNRDVTTRVETHAQFFIGPDAPIVYGSLWAAAWFVLLIACANLANLTLARTLTRSREFSTRIALGAGRWRIIRQLLTESLLLATVSAALAWWIAKTAVHTWAIATDSQYQILDYSLYSGTVAYLAAISIFAALLFGIVPIARIFQLDVNGTLKGDARGVTHGLRAKLLSASLVTVQMILAVVLLSGAGVLARSFYNVVGADIGLRTPENVLIGRARVPRAKYATPESRLAFLDQVRSRLANIPGVESASLANIFPVNIPGLTPLELDDHRKPPAVVSVAAAPNYFHAVGASTIAGREFNDTDLPNMQPVAIVNQSFVAKFWPGQNALGKRVRLNDGPWRTVVGVASNIMQGDPIRQEFKPIVYVPLRERAATTSPSFFVRTRGPAEQLASVVRTELLKLNPDITLEDFQTLQANLRFRADRMDLEHVEMGKHAAVAPIFAVIALLLAAIGLYAVIAHSVNQRTKEIGVRMAIGADASNIRHLIFREGMQPVVIGLALGLLASLAVNRVLESQLVGVSATDPITLASAGAVLIAVALLGCQIPARRAVRIDPASALRVD
jgi:predicted permease